MKTSGCTRAHRLVQAHAAARPDRSPSPGRRQSAENVNVSITAGWCCSGALVGWRLKAALRRRAEARAGRRGPERAPDTRCAGRAVSRSGPLSRSEVAVPRAPPGLDDAARCRQTTTVVEYSTIRRAGPIGAAPDNCPSVGDVHRNAARHTRTRLVARHDRGRAIMGHRDRRCRHCQKVSSSHRLISLASRRNRSMPRVGIVADTDP